MSLVLGSFTILIFFAGVTMLVQKGRYVLALLSFIVPFLALAGFFISDRDGGGTFGP